MTELLYPRLPLPTAREMASELRTLSIEELVQRSATAHPAVTYATTGGSRISEMELHALQRSVRVCAADYGYPLDAGEDALRRFDIECAVYLHENMFLYASEASHIEMWAFMALVLLPDVVRWRFYREQTSEDRFIGTDRGMRRSTFGRLWWRAYTLHQPEQQEPYRLLSLLYEDDLVQITERNQISASRSLATAYAEAFVRAVDTWPDIPRRTLMREGTKRVRRLLSFVAFDALDVRTLQETMDNVFRVTAEAVLQTGVRE